MLKLASGVWQKPGFCRIAQKLGFFSPFKIKPLFSGALLLLIFARFILQGLVRVTWNIASDAIDQGSYLQLGLFIREGRAFTDGNRSPLYPAILALFARREWAYFTEAKLLSFLFGLAGLLLVFYLARKMFGISVALVTVLLLSANDGFQMEASWVACEVLLIPLFFLAWYLVAEGFRKRRCWLWAGAVAGLCQLTKGNGHLLAVAFLVGGLLSLGRYFLRERWAYAFVAAYLVTISPLLAINTLTFGDPFYNYNTSHALWFDQWEDAYRVNSPPPTMASYLGSHSLEEVWQRQRYGMRRAAFDGAGALFPFFLQEREQRALVVGIGGLLALGGVLLSWRTISRDEAKKSRFRGTLAFSGVLFTLFYLLFAWYARVISKPHFFLPPTPIAYAGGLGAMASLSRLRWPLGERVRNMGRVLYMVGGLVLAGWLLYTVVVTVPQLRDPYQVDLEVNLPREDVLRWLVARTEPGEPVLWGPSHTLPRWKYTPRLEFVPIPVDVGSWPELETYVHQQGIRYWILDFSTIGRREELLGPYFDRHYEQIVFQQPLPRWELVHADRKFIFDYCVFRVYPKGQGSPPMSPLSQIGVGSQIQLLGYHVSLENIPSGKGVDLALHWRARERVEGNYKVFTHLLNPEGTLHSQHDDQPLYGFWPTGAWEPGQTLVDHHHLPLGDAASGVYRLEVGLYDGETMERLPITDLSTGQVLSDHLILPAMVRVGASLNDAPTGSKL